MENRHVAFAKGIMNKYQNIYSGYYYGSSVVHRRKKENSVRIEDYWQINKIFTREFYKRIRLYENKYYQAVTSQDNRKFIRTIEQIYNQPGEKKQLIHLFKKFGVITNNEEEWQETKLIMKQYEEELFRLKKQLELQEESVVKKKSQEIQQITTKTIMKEVVEYLKQEMKMERLRYGLD
ncbi:MAG: hypothetical protein HFJ06_11180 [Lachnospiraceae bacterium]|nr:hypothetical protein [Lachnospiraceae bacterium]